MYRKKKFVEYDHDDSSDDMHHHSVRHTLTSPKEDLVMDVMNIIKWYSTHHVLPLCEYVDSESVKLLLEHI